MHALHLCFLFILTNTLQPCTPSMEHECQIILVSCLFDQHVDLLLDADRFRVLIVSPEKLVFNSEEHLFRICICPIHDAIVAPVPNHPAVQRIMKEHLQNRQDQLSLLAHQLHTKLHLLP